jgi:acetyl esterase/lipase
MREKLAAYLAIADPAARQKAHEELQQLGFPHPWWYLERAWRSAREKKGRTEDRLLTLRSREHKGVYTLYVPESYDPLRPTPLVIGLHGGGRGGKDGKAVVGSGPGAMNFYERGAARLGWIVACPTAIEAPWSAKPNDGFLLAVLDEVCLLFNVDRNRVYLTGHSMGGYGAWHFGPLHAHLWAAISPMAGGGGGGGALKKLEDTLTGVYLYHGADDPVVGVEDDHAVALQMKARGMDFAYAEIPDSGHGFPPEVEAEMWEFFEVRRLATVPGGGDKGRFSVTQEPSSSFLPKPSKEEADYLPALGKPASKDDAPASSIKPLLADLRAGGGLAQKAAERLAAIHEAEAASQVAAVLSNASLASDSRRFAAEALGGMKRVEGAKALQAAMADPDLGVLGAAAWAYGRVGPPSPAKVYERCVADLKQRFEKKKTGAQMEFSDFESHLDALVRLADGIEATRDPACVPALVKIGNDFLLPQLSVDATERAGQNPAAPRRRLAKALLDACAALKNEASLPLLAALARRADLGVDAAASELIATLEKEKP